MSRKFLLIIFFLSFSYVFPFKITTHLNRNRVKIGDIFHYRIVVQTKGIARCKIKRGEYFDFYVRSFKTTFSGGEKVFEFELQPFFLGKKKIFEIPIYINQKILHYKTPVVEVYSITSDSSAKPLMGPFEIVESGSKWIYYFSPLPFILIFFLLFKFFRKRKNDNLVNVDVEEELEEHPEKYLMKIDGLKKSRLYEKDSRYFAFLLSQIIREILGESFSKNFLIMTNEEIIDFLERLTITIKGDLFWVLNSCELVEFSNFTFEKSFFEKMIESSIRIAKYFSEEK